MKHLQMYSRWNGYKKRKSVIKYYEIFMNKILKVILPKDLHLFTPQQMSRQEM